MGGGYWVKKVEESKIWAASGKGVESGGVCMGENESMALPLTFMDIPWLLFPPTQPLFFFQLDGGGDGEEDVFSRNVVPKLKESLAAALDHFYPLASTLVLCSKHENEAHLQLSFPCSIPLTVAVAHISHHHPHHHHLFSNHPMDAAFFHLLVPHLPTLTLPPHPSHPLFSIQITHFPSSSNSFPPAFSIGFASHPLLSDQRTFHHFLTTWSSFSKLAHPPPPPSLPSFDRSPIIDPTTTDLHSTLLNHSLSSHSLSLPLPMSPTTLLPMDMLRATFVITPTHIHHTRLWIQARCDHSHTPHPPLLSPYVVTCAIVWACFAQLQYHSNPKPHASSSPMYMGFIAGGITRLPYPVPTNYFGNCVAFGRAVAEREDLLLLPRHLNQNEHNEENENENENENDGKVYENQGILAAAHAISKAIKDLDADVLGQAHRWILDWEPIIGTDQHINMVGSPKVELYEIDFGWGTPKKIEEISIDGMRGRGVSLMQSREVKGGIEIGVTLPSSAMHTFSFLFNQTLAFMSSPT